MKLIRDALAYGAFAAVLILACSPAKPLPVDSSAAFAGDDCAKAAANEERLACPEWIAAKVTREVWAQRCRDIEAAGYLKTCPLCIARARSCAESDTCRPPTCGDP